MRARALIALVFAGAVAASPSPAAEASIVRAFGRAWEVHAPEDYCSLDLSHSDEAAVASEMSKQLSDGIVPVGLYVDCAELQSYRASKHTIERYAEYLLIPADADPVVAGLTRHQFIDGLYNAQPRLSALELKEQLESFTRFKILHGSVTKMGAVARDDAAVYLAEYFDVGAKTGITVTAASKVGRNRIALLFTALNRNEGSFDRLLALARSEAAGFVSANER